MPENPHSCRHTVYDLTCQQYEDLLAASGNRCQARGIPAARTKPRKLFFDHDHNVGRWAVRGLLCPPVPAAGQEPLFDHQEAGLA